MQSWAPVSPPPSQSWAPVSPPPSQPWPQSCPPLPPARRPRSPPPGQQPVQASGKPPCRPGVLQRRRSLHAQPAAGRPDASVASCSALSDLLPRPARRALPGEGATRAWLYGDAAAQAAPQQQPAQHRLQRSASAASSGTYATAMSRSQSMDGAHSVGLLSRAGSADGTFVSARSQPHDLDLSAPPDEAPGLAFSTLSSPIRCSLARSSIVQQRSASWDVPRARQGQLPTRKTHPLLERTPDLHPVRGHGRPAYSGHGLGRFTNSGLPRQPAAEVPLSLGPYTDLQHLTEPPEQPPPASQRWPLVPAAEPLQAATPLPHQASIAEPWLPQPAPAAAQVPGSSPGLWTDSEACEQLDVGAPPRRAPDSADLGSWESQTPAFAQGTAQAPAAAGQADAQGFAAPAAAAGLPDDSGPRAPGQRRAHRHSLQPHSGPHIAPPNLQPPQPLQDSWQGALPQTPAKQDPTALQWLGKAPDVRDSAREDSAMGYHHPARTLAASPAGAARMQPPCSDVAACGFLQLAHSSCPSVKQLPALSSMHPLGC